MLGDFPWFYSQEYSICDMFVFFFLNNVVVLGPGLYISGLHSKWLNAE